MLWQTQAAGTTARTCHPERSEGSVPAIVTIALLLLAAALTSACSQPPSTPPAPVLIRLSGSTSMQPLLRELAAAYSKDHPFVSLDFTAVGSAAGIEELRRGNADLALVSRELYADEEFDPQTGERQLAYTVIAQDGIAVVVNATNRVRELTLYQIRNIFDGQVTAWDELGGAAEEIVVISREDGSGTREVFEEVAMYGRRMTPTALIMPGSEVVREYVSAHEGAIGYLSMGALGPGVAAVGIDGVAPTRQAVEDGSYLISRPYLLVSSAEPDAQVAAFMRFARGPAGQAIVRRTYGGARTRPQ
jgi:phosphate transport system substrate-binding protein